MRRWAGRPGKWRAAALGISAALVLSACGSTVQWEEMVRANGQPGAGTPEGQLGAADPGTADGAEPGADGPADGDPGGASQDAPGGSAGAKPGGSTSATSTPSGSVAAPPAGSSGRGFTKREIRIGYATQKDAETLGKQIGAGVDFGDQEAIAKAIVKDINARGGVAGRKLELVFFDIKSAESTQDPNRVAQAACERWTKDTQVFAAISLATSINNDTLFSCMAKRQTPLVLNDVGMHDAARLAPYSGYVYAPSVPALERLVPTWLQRAKSQGYFKGGWDTVAGRSGTTPRKIGLLHTNNPALGADKFGSIAERALAKQGLPVAAKYQHSGNMSTVSGDMSQAVLRFQQAGVTHVVADSMVFFFMQAAESQNYRPRYALTSFHAITAIQDTASRRQLTGALGVGYVPTIDVDNARDPGDVSGAQARCRKVMKQAGQNTSNRQAMLIMTLACDGFNFLTSAVKKGSLSPAGIQQGAKAMGSLSPAATFGISFPGGRPDGASAARDLSYRSDIGRFAYSGGKNHGM